MSDLIKNTGRFYGPNQQVANRKPPKFDPVAKEHYWILTGAWKCNPEETPINEFILDHENFLVLQGPLCYFCEKDWNSRSKFTRCKGMAR